MSPFHVIFLRGRTGVDRHSSKNWCGASGTCSSAMRGVLKTRGGCRASIAHAFILLHAWSPKNEGWVQSVPPPRVHRPRVHLITRVENLKRGVGAERTSPTRGALKMGGGCRASIAHVWSRHNDEWPRGRVDAWTRGRNNRPIFLNIFLKKINHATSQKLYRSYYPHRSRDSLSPVCGIFLLLVCMSRSNFTPWILKRGIKIPHTGDKASLDRCG